MFTDKDNQNINVKFHNFMDDAYNSSMSFSLCANTYQFTEITLPLTDCFHFVF